MVSHCPHRLLLAAPGTSWQALVSLTPSDLTSSFDHWFEVHHRFPFLMEMKWASDSLMPRKLSYPEAAVS